MMNFSSWLNRDVWHDRGNRGKLPCAIKLSAYPWEGVMNGLARFKLTVQVTIRIRRFLIGPTTGIRIIPFRGATIILKKIKMVLLTVLPSAIMELFSRRSELLHI